MNEKLVVVREEKKEENEVVGRKKEIEKISKVLNKLYSPYIALIGANGVGKRSIIRKYAKDCDTEISTIDGNTLMSLLKIPNAIYDAMHNILTDADKNNKILVVKNGQNIADGSILELLNETTVPTVFISTIENCPSNYEVMKIEPLPKNELKNIALNVIGSLEKHYNISFGEEKEKIVNIAVDLKGEQNQPKDAIKFLEDIAINASEMDLEEKKFRKNFKSDYAEKLLDSTVPIVQHHHIDQVMNKFYRGTTIQGVYGQEEAIHKIEEHLKKKQLGFYDDKPLTLFFAGPTGVGKTETAKKIAELTGMGLLRIDMTTMSTEHSITRLIGSPPGYIGYQDGGIIPNKLKRNSKLVILFDEVEKAHPRIMDSVLIPSGEGIIQDSKGEEFSCKDCIIIFTSNIGAIEDKSLGFNSISRGKKERTIEAVKDSFRPEFIGRIDDLCVFNSLEESAMREVAEREVEKLEELSGTKVDKQIIDEIIAKVNKEYGAREVKKLTRDLAGSYIIQEMGI